MKLHPILIAVAQNDLSELQRMIDKAIDADYNNAAYDYQQNSLVQKLFAAHDEKGRNALHIAAYHGFLECAKILVENGADINALDFGQNTPLHIACSRKSVELVYLLVEQGCAIDIANFKGVTPLHFAAREKDIKILHFLLDNGCDPDAVAADGICYFYKKLLSITLLLLFGLKVFKLLLIMVLTLTWLDIGLRTLLLMPLRITVST